MDGKSGNTPAERIGKFCAEWLRMPNHNEQIYAVNVGDDRRMAELETTDLLCLLRDNTEMLEALKDAVDLADGLVESMDYLGSGSDIKEATKYQCEDRALVAGFRAFIAKVSGT